MNFYKYFKNYINIENINTITFHNITYENYLSGKEVKINNELYQSLLSYFFDDFNIEKNRNNEEKKIIFQNIKKIILKIHIFIYMKK